MVEQVSQGLVAVEQCDRELAADFAWVDGDVATQKLRWGIRQGRRDDHFVVQASARHRLAERERCARIAEDAAEMRRQLYAENEAPINAHRAVQAEEIATAIRSSSEGPKG